MRLLRVYRNILLVLLAPIAFVFVPTFFLPGPEVDIPIYSKSGARTIARELRSKGIIHFTLPFRLLTKWTGADRRLKAGLYRFDPRLSLWGVLGELTSGKSELVTLKVPEGFTVEQIADELEGLKVVAAADFIKASRDPGSLRTLGVPGPSLEGFLFPETYRIPVGASPQALADLMVRQFQETVGEDFDRRCRARGLTAYQGVILASIVEKEAKRTEERPVIAGVLYNRLHQGMRLQVNATLNYVLNVKDPWFTNAQINTQSPYNTYFHRGLPPTPICNPGQASLDAVLDPVASSYLYYVAQGDGSHLFAATFGEHEQNVRKAKRIRHLKRVQKELGAPPAQ